MPTTATFSVWAPRAVRLTLRVYDVGPAGRDLAMEAGLGGWWHTRTDAAPDAGYAYLIDDDPTPLPDPRSLRQPNGVHGPSQVYDHADYTWRDSEWTGRPLAGSVIYELHVGTFTEDGTLDAAIGRLDHLVELGVDAVELLPVNAFNGTHNWGYDGVLWYAVHEAYGGPDAYKRFVEACHLRGLSVIQDVVYNHLGPSGNYLPRFGPYLSDSGRNTWGRTVNLDGPESTEVRRYIIDNALMWLRDYHVDGLRLDAVHALSDSSATHLLEELAGEVDALSAHVRRPLTLVAESDLNDPRLITPREAGGHGLTAQWSDDFHHVLHALLTGERQGYYVDFGSLASVAKVLTRGYFHDGTWSTFRGRRHGRPLDTTRTLGWRLLGYLQNHDQIGNRATGDRLSDSVPASLLGVGAALVLTAPFTPMVFMGEEWGASTPWQFFTSHPEPELAAATAEGRRREFADHGWDTEDVPDPQDLKTFERSKLDWNEPAQEPHATLLATYRRLIRLRKRYPQLSDPRLDRLQVEYDEVARWMVVTRWDIRVVVNLAPHAQDIALDRPVEHVLLHTDEPPEVRGNVVEVPPESAVIALMRDTTEPQPW